MKASATALAALAAVLLALAGGATALNLSLRACSTGPASPCATCSARKPDTCVKCKDGYYLPQRSTLGKCKECPEWCTLCNSAGFCLGCAAGHRLRGDGTCAPGRATGCMPNVGGCVSCWEDK
ncbi:hypothetical protein CHLNCDRAFT_49311 [Chlorella variabilis]|uniref:TNFR-Cys domain-containing protein n=1 Tax=Chlorella variabilis TaxID=554065 RepID=E1Z3N5_CHLVA|nr:hypothetical protein CHLNCDRAFT_49311 [Chlorella variabilis]EFN59878.1 hypothetical protein CHLNCDRAFT_49311 [Chlorella variabilis]|eukprot:XP_005851980.1 hypothetical protein CHLNCDRAFT_49311 [Chlorella variabilis]